MHCVNVVCCNNSCQSGTGLISCQRLKRGLLPGVEFNFASCSRNVGASNVKFYHHSEPKVLVLALHPRKPGSEDRYHSQDNRTVTMDMTVTRNCCCTKAVMIEGVQNKTEEVR
jgi:hypothetical protein